ncbi:hypothetical protein [Streptomyces sp. MP131-18]|uniref:hypothetical protein n=1 Tax=Streptomyces sp. MP131-18 TaxID=1857892 RepID=UPI0015C544F3|nr:hypothetical protein [Streptomyces sp. MP131-18]
MAALLEQDGLLSNDSPPASSGVVVSAVTALGAWTSRARVVTYPTAYGATTRDAQQE